ncbi:MAG: hypothetical protein KAG18_08865, partial [Sinobacterium sp.]|nr:hypothetical protein [Sinobacterium sp.]
MNKYFSSFAENEVSLLQSFKSDLDCRQPLFSQAVCIPFFDEDLTLLSSLQSAAQCYAKTENPLPRLLILCINRGDNSEPCNKNEAAIAFIQTLTTRWKNQTLSLHDYSDNLTILLIDRNSVPLIPIKQGVGLARKIAGDIAAYFIDEAVIESKFFFSSDADVIFPDNYFSEFIRSANQSQEMN